MCLYRNIYVFILARFYLLINVYTYVYIIYIHTIYRELIFSIAKTIESIHHPDHYYSFMQCIDIYIYVYHRPYGKLVFLQKY